MTRSELVLTISKSRCQVRQDRTVKSWTELQDDAVALGRSTESKACLLPSRVRQAVDELVSLPLSLFPEPDEAFVLSL